MSKNQKGEPRFSKIERVTGYLREPTSGKISISSKFQILKSHPDFEISTKNCSCEPDFDRGLASK